MAPHSSTLAWKIPCTEEPGGLQSMGSLRVGHDWVTSFWLFTFMHWRRKWQPTPVFLPGGSQGWRSLWAAIYGVAQSRTRLKRLSSSSSKENVGKSEHCTTSRNAKRCSLCGEQASGSFLRKWKREPPQNTAVPLLRVYPKELKAEPWRNYFYTRVLTTWFTLAKRWKQHKCLSTDKWINNIRIHTMEKSSGSKKAGTDTGYNMGNFWGCYSK